MRRHTNAEARKAFWAKWISTLGLSRLPSRFMVILKLWWSHEGLMLDYEEALTRLFPLPPGLQPRSPPGSPPTTIQPARPIGHDTCGTGSSGIPRFPLAGSGSIRPSEDVGPLTAHYNTSAHFLWVGDRTRQLNGGHIEYFRGIRNPIGVKVGPSMQAEELVKLLGSESIYEVEPPMLMFATVVNPNRESGKVTLITRYGAAMVCLRV